MRFLGSRRPAATANRGELRVARPTLDQRTGESPRPDGGSVVVAISGRADTAAVEWAAAEAEARYAALHLLVSLTPRLTPEGKTMPYGLAMDVLNDDAHELLGHCAQVARRVAPGVDVTGGVQLRGSGCAVAPGAAESLVVIARSDLRGGLPRSLGVAARRLLRTEGCAGLAVVSLTDGTCRGPSAGRVVVEIDEKDRSAAVPAFAFAAARRRGVGVTVVHPPIAEAVPDTGRGAGPARLGLPLLDPRLAAAIRPFQRAFPDVDVRALATSTPTAAALVRHAEGAALLVVGAPRRVFRRLPRRTRTVVSSAGGPVALVPCTGRATDRPRGHRTGRPTAAGGDGDGRTGARRTG